MIPSLDLDDKVHHPLYGEGSVSSVHTIRARSRPDEYVLYSVAWTNGMTTYNHEDEQNQAKEFPAKLRKFIHGSDDYCDGWGDYVADPYDLDVHGERNMAWMCAGEYRESEMDI